MAEAMEKFSEEDMRPGDVRRRWRAVKRLMEFFNAFFNFQIITTSGKNLLTIARGNVTLELNIPAAASGTPTTTPPPFTVLKAEDDTHPGRVRVYNGRLNDFLPDEMDLPDAELPNGTDNRCFLTMSQGLNYVYAKLLYSDGTPQSANVYRVDSPEEADGTFLYFLVATVTYDDGALTIVQEGSGNQSSAPYSSADGETIYPDW